MDVKLGDRVRRKVEYGMSGGTLLPEEWGTVVYIHPAGRFYSVEFVFAARDGRVERFRESYWPDPAQPDRSAKDGPAGRISSKKRRLHNGKSKR